MSILEWFGTMTFPHVTEAMKRRFTEAQPFSYITMDEFIRPDKLEEIHKEIKNMTEDNWLSHQDPMANEMIFQKKKMGLNKPEWLPSKAANIMHLFNSQRMLHYLEELTGITDLIADPDFTGGGLHRTKTGGKLSVHADFNIHPHTGLHRRLNVLLYLNKDWNSVEWKGDLELWSKDMKECVKRISPDFNRIVIFRITDDAYHGHPEELTCPDNVDRLSFAFYYYTKDRPEHEKAPFHWADWQPRPETGF